ncbi:MAG: hypothetical protein QY323_04425 [Patescibacteria group bacterium]|nr:MAG: hypothetical protein QY323_04425 [Patescibacteria group bacterium]
MIAPVLPKTSETASAPCERCNGEKFVRTPSGTEPCIVCTPGRKCPICASKVVRHGPCGMCGHHVDVPEEGI